MKINEISVAYTTAKPGDYPDEFAAEIAFIGRSNVGKSSLLNSLACRRGLARTSKAPGRTRCIRWYRLEGTQKTCFFVDLPGYGYAKVSRQLREQAWARLVETYLGSHRPLALALQLLDIRRNGPTNLDWQMIDWLRSHKLPHAFVLTKADKLPRGRCARAVARFESELGNKPSDVIPFSATTGDGRLDLWSAIDRALADFSSSTRTSSPAMRREHDPSTRRV